MQDPQGRLLLRISEAAERLGVGRSTLYEMIHSGQIVPVRIGRAVRIPVARLAEWVEAQAREADARRGGEAV